ncbi:hypothetical protein EVAR_42753_1 [Eumeta japonica]|uniref:Uncharacterized protein n=1 Tax=Eumeta variegata TaxID=151549 RepID=A0A4C1WM59_EUMVA|nr:hypothetical protein EVAR_42753_1 [Eumeta japonica]
MNEFGSVTCERAVRRGNRAHAPDRRSARENSRVSSGIPRLLHARRGRCARPLHEITFQGSSVKGTTTERRNNKRTRKLLSRPEVGGQRRVSGHGAARDAREAR